MRSPIVTLLTAALFLATTQAAEPPLPANVAPEPGRLVGWGNLATDLPVADTLPQGAAAEGFIQVRTTAQNWIALHESGRALMGGNQPWAKQLLPDFGQKVVQVAISDHWAVLLEDGTVRCGGDPARNDMGIHEVPTEIKDIVQIEAAYHSTLALDRSGKLHLWGDRELLGTGFHPKIASLTTGVQLFANYNRKLVWQRKDGKVYHMTWWNLEKFWEDKPMQGALQLAANEQGNLALMADGSVLKNSSKGTARRETEAPAMRVEARHRYELIQQSDGTWLSLGANYQGEADPERLNDLLAFSLSGHAGEQRGFGVGITRSALAAPVVERSVPELTALLSELNETEESAGVELKAWKDRYFQALDGVAAKQPSPALNAVIAEEKEQAEVRDRPPTARTELARYQAVYRERLPALLDAREEARLAALDGALVSLQKLQDQLTREKRLEDAVTVRSVSEQLTAKRSVLAERLALPSTASPLPPTSPAPQRTFPPIPPEDRIFAVGDKPVPGELVVIGSLEGRPIELPSSVNHRRMVSVKAGSGCWIVLDERGDFFCDGKYGRQQFGRTPKSLRGLQEVRTFGPNGAYFGWDKRDNFVAWGWDGFPEKTVNFPSFFEEGPLEQVSLRLTEGDAVPSIRRALALKPAGTLLAGGPQYDEGKPPWILPPDLGPCRDTFSSRDFDAVLKANGSVVAWGPKKATIPSAFTDLALWAKGWRLILGLRRDGQIVAWKPEGGIDPKLLDIPRGLTDVVDLVWARDLALALRADGTWIGWGTNPDGMLEKLDQLQGCRQVAIGGTSLERYILAIRPE